MVQWLWMALLPTAVVAPLRTAGPLSPRLASYEIAARLDEGKKVVSGSETIHWKNGGGGPTTTLVLHLYMNAFKNNRSTFLGELPPAHRVAMPKAHFGAIDVTALSVDGVALLPALKVDDTLATVTLPRPVSPGETVELHVDFTTTLPEVIARTGYHGDFFAVAQWFPKVAVWDCDPGPHEAPASCRWRAHQHHANSEFFADFGVYDVALDLPAGWTVGATGVRVATASDGGRQHLRYRAEDVHDFVFTTSPRLHLHSGHFDDSLGSLRLNLLTPPGRDADAPRQLAAMRAALAEFERRLGPYPYAELTAVDVPAGAEAAGGMEYPTLFFTQGMPAPPGLHLPESVTVHELAHQYFQGMVASDEVEEPWLDEGLTQTATDWALQRQFGSDGSLYDLWGHHFGGAAQAQLGLLRSEGLDPSTTRAFEFVSPRSYGAISYARTHLLLRTVEAQLGSDKFEAGMRHYFKNARFTHPRSADFVRLFDEGAGVDLRDWWHQALFSASALDYAVLEVSAEREPPPIGLFDEGGKRVERSAPAKPDPAAPWRSEVVVQRRGDLILPVEVRVVFKDGSERRERWDGGTLEGPRWRRFRYTQAEPVAYAEVDPDGKLALDAHRWNNGRRAEPDPTPRRRALAWLGHLVSLGLSLVGF